MFNNYTLSGLSWLELEQKDANLGFYAVLMTLFSSTNEVDSLASLRLKRLISKTDYFLLVWIGYQFGKKTQDFMRLRTTSEFLSVEFRDINENDRPNDVIYSFLLFSMESVQVKIGSWKLREAIKKKVIKTDKIGCCILFLQKGNILAWDSFVEMKFQISSNEIASH